MLVFCHNSSFIVCVWVCLFCLIVSLMLRLCCLIVLRQNNDLLVAVYVFGRSFRSVMCLLLCVVLAWCWFVYVLSCVCCVCYLA